MVNKMSESWQIREQHEKEKRLLAHGRVHISLCICLSAQAGRAAGLYITHCHPQVGGLPSSLLERSHTLELQFHFQTSAVRPSLGLIHFFQMNLWPYKW